MSIVVQIEEEYGYRNWIWLTGMSAEELKAWWSSKKTVNAFFYDGPVSFPIFSFQTCVAISSHPPLLLHQFHLRPHSK